MFETGAKKNFSRSKNVRKNSERVKIVRKKYGKWAKWQPKNLGRHKKPRMEKRKKIA